MMSYIEGDSLMNDMQRLTGSDSKLDNEIEMNDIHIDIKQKKDNED